ncbi:MAG: conjugal transfer protein TraF [Gallionellaceae bacterium]|nr:conjugal transfer protein TraF [Gallionellaceae bacterium]
MQKKYFKIAATTALLLSSATVLALPFNSFDPRTMAMGGAGVAVDDPSTAPFFNPALLSATDPTKKYSIELPVIGARAYDPGELRTKLDTLNTNITALNNSITATNLGSSPTSAQIALLPGRMSTVSTNITTVNNLLNSLSNQPIQGEFGAATVIGVPGKNYGFAFYANAWAAVGGTLEYNDSTTLSNLSTSVSSAANALSSTTGTAAAACTAVQNGTGTSADISTCLAAASNIASTLVNAQGVVNFSTSTQIASKIHLRGVIVSEAGLSVSHGFVTNNHEWSLGVTPKIMQLQLFDALLSATNGSSTSAVTGSDYLAKYNAYNFDLGLAKSYNNGWRTGFVIKNVIPQTFDFKSIASGAATGSAQSTTGTLNMKPQARVGVSRSNTWSTVAFDLDLTQNDPAGLENKSQYAALGGELSAWGWAQIRAGYRADLLNTARNVASVGLGISPRIPYFKPHLDIGVAGNKNEVGASLRLGFNF